MNISLTGPWDVSQIEEFLDQTRVPIRLSAVAEDGFPRVISLWFLYAQDTLYCVTHQSSKLASLLQNDNRVGFEVSADAPPYYGVRGQGLATLQALGSDPTLATLLTRYLGGLDSDFAKWLLSRSDEELLITIQPHRLFSWDYRKRMSGAT